MLRDLDRGVAAAATGVDVLRVELLGGDLAMAEKEFARITIFLLK